jgi:hypothetical protein
MSRFRRATPIADDVEKSIEADGSHEELVERVAAYCSPMVPDPLRSSREQHLSGFRFARALDKALMTGTTDPSGSPR